ncbi:hypothetical protein AGMMS49546_33200 [Spirochaetia bacterium]|nr:hypothetical protein AGMMS49546_33200 [Spirochaetia bacterium]
MQIKIDVNDLNNFNKYYEGILSLDNIDISEDNVAYGIYDILIIGMTFIFEASLSGLTWDLIKEQMMPYIKALISQKRKEDNVYISIFDGKENYDLEIPNNFNDIEIKIPKKLEMRLKK